MENFAELLKTIDPSQIDEALALLQNLRNNAAATHRSSGEGEPVNRSGGACRSSPETDTQQPEQLRVGKGQFTALPVQSSADGASGTVAEEDEDTPLASLGHVLSSEEKKQTRSLRKAEREAEKELRRKAKEEEAVLVKAELDARKVLCDDEREGRRVVRDEERDARKAEKEAEREARRKARDEEQEAEREARQKAREAEKEALKLPKEAPNSLAQFGFLSSGVKAESNKNKLFSAFVQDKRIAPEALRFWVRPEDRAAPAEEDVSVVALPSLAASGGARRDAESSRTRPMDEESSLLHPPMCVDDGAPPKARVCVRDFNAMIEASHAREVPLRDLLRQCGCAFHAAASDPYTSFDNEVVFAGFFAVGYDPCQSRPPYFGTYNHLQEGNLNEAELLQMGRFPLRRGIPRLSNIDYGYDSGDDWDVMDGDEDIAASSSDDSDADADADSLDSSDLEFINDSDEDDSDCDIQRRIMEARQRRLNRLRNKDKLVPSYSGPFVGIPLDEHPLRGFDELERFAPLDAAYFSKLLGSELNAFASGNVGIPAGGEEGLSAEELEAKRQRALTEAALKNRREMTDAELKALHTIVAANSKVSSRMILGAFKEQQLCVGVARAEIARTIKRLYERHHGSFVLRSEPWSPTDERLFVRVAAPKKPQQQSGDGGGGVISGPGGECEDRNEEEYGGGDDDGDVDEAADDASASVGDVVADGSPAPLPALLSEAAEEAGHPAPSPRNSDEARAGVAAPKTKQMTLTELLPKAGSAKRPREDEQEEDQDGGVTTSTGS